MEDSLCTTESERFFIMFSSGLSDLSAVALNELSGTGLDVCNLLLQQVFSSAQTLSKYKLYLDLKDSKNNCRKIFCQSMLSDNNVLKFH